MSSPLSGPATCLTSSPPSTSNPSSTASQPLITSSSTPSSASSISVGVLQKVVTIPKIITPTSSSGVQRRESCQGSGATKTPVPTETNSWPSLNKLKRAKPKDVKTSQSAPSGCRRKPVAIIIINCWEVQ